ncbi:MAG: Ppx/GppA family phosphatase [Myxococcales bacterium]|nr:Ppx/GppA family phosphatase [Myxococcales bacterium]
MERERDGDNPWQAIIDIGTNTVLLLLARPRAGEAALEVADDRAIITRLGEGVAQRGELSPAAIARTLDALRNHRAAAEELGAEIVAVTTEGVRLARNPDDFLVPAAAVLGVPVRMISGEEEARLSYLSVARESGGGTLRVIDIGGASTELVVGEGEAVLEAVSHPIGSVRLTERFISSDPPARGAIREIEEEVRRVLAGQPLTPFPCLWGLAGTVTTAAALLLGLDRYDRDRVDGSEHALGSLIELRDRLAAQTIDERVSPILERKRADVIVAGITILIGAMEHAGAETLIVRDRGLRYALVDRSPVGGPAAPIVGAPEEVTAID